MTRTEEMARKYALRVCGLEDTPQADVYLGNNNAYNGDDLRKAYIAGAMEQWHKVSEELPEEDCIVLVAHLDDNGDPVYNLGKWDYGWKEWQDGYGDELYEGDKYTHWMYFPEVPDEDEP